MAMPAATEESRDRYSRRGVSQQLKRIFSTIDVNNDGKLGPTELRDYLKTLNYAPGLREIQEMIWEVDEDHDGHVGWAEFERSFDRCMADKAGREPRKLHNVLLFAINLENGATKLSFDAAARLTYLSHGRENLESQMEATFGKMDNGQGLALTEFLHAMTESHIKRFPRHKAAESTLKKAQK